MWWLLTVDVVLGCANIVHETGELAESTGQQAILARDGSETVVEYLVQYEGDAADFGWIVPIPGAFVDLDDGDEARFESLAQASAPAVEYLWDEPDEDGGGCGCGGAAKGGDSLNEAPGQDLGVEVVAEGFAGPYAFTVVQATNTADLNTWLTDHDWDLGTTSPSVDEYVQDGGYQFVLVTLQPNIARTPIGGRNLPPVRIRYEGSELRFPARMARYVTAESQRTTLYVLGPQRARITSGWPLVDLGYVDAGNATDPAQAWVDTLVDHDGSYLLTWSDSWNGQWATRVDTLSTAASHTDDVVFEVDDGAAPARLTLEIWGKPSGAGLLLLPLLGWMRRRKTA